MLRSLLLYILLHGVFAQCPPMSIPCQCTSTISEPISILCHHATSLDQIVRAIPSNIIIDRLDIRQTPIQALPPYAFGNRTISALSIRKAGLSTISDKAFGGHLLESITDIDLGDNALQDALPVALAEFRNLKRLSLASNRISTIPAKAFSNYSTASKLQRLDLSGNLLSDLDAASFDGLFSLKELTLRKNFLTRISMALKPLQGSLEALNLGLNRITRVGIDELQFPNLTSLSLEFNKIKGLDAEAFHGLPNLRYLYLSGNKINQTDMIRFSPKLLVLGISEMPIMKLTRDTFRHNPDLRRLEMTDSVVTEIENGTFQTIRDTIEVIVLGRTSIRGQHPVRFALKRIRNDMFQGLPKLLSLDLRGKGIQVVEDRAFADLPSLRHLDISNNQLKVLQPDTFRSTFLPVRDSRVLYLCGKYCLIMWNFGGGHLFLVRRFGKVGEELKT